MGLFDFFKKKRTDEVVNRTTKIEKTSKQSTLFEESPRLQTVETENSFYLLADDVHSVTGRGTVVTGQVQGGRIKCGDTAYLIKNNGEIIDTKINGIGDLTLKSLAQNVAEVGETVGLLLRGIFQDEVDKGDFISATKKNTNFSNLQTSLETKPDYYKQKSQTNSLYTSNDSVRGLLYVRFNIDAVEGGAYGLACYKIVFANAPTHALQGCVVSMGDSNATLFGRENVCIIGLAGSVGQLQIIMNALKGTKAFTSVCAINPLVLNGGAEPLVEDGTFTEDGSLLFSWAKSAFNSVNKR